jgi:hypothetical protein
MFRQGTGTIEEEHREFFAEAGDARQVWARRLGGAKAEVFFLPDGGVTDHVRRDCAEGRLVCPMEDCPDPRFIARGGGERRHHFAHRVAHVKHAAAAVWRQEAMTMLADWARHYRGARVEAEDGDRVATVRIVSERTGHGVELRITYDRRFELPYEISRDPSRQLLLGHTRGLLLPRQPCAEHSGAWWCGESRLVGDLVDADRWALAVNPEQRLIGTLLDSWTALRIGVLPRATHVAYPSLCVVCPLDDCRLTEHGLTTPTVERVLQQRERERTVASRVTGSGKDAAQPPVTSSAPHPTQPVDPRQAEYLLRAQGLNTEERLALIKEMFLPPQTGG